MAIRVALAWLTSSYRRRVAFRPQHGPGNKQAHPKCARLVLAPTRNGGPAVTFEAQMACGDSLVTSVAISFQAV